MDRWVTWFRFGFFFVGWGYWMLALIDMNIIALICCFFGGLCFVLIGDVSVVTYCNVLFFSEGIAVA